MNYNFYKNPERLSFPEPDPYASPKEKKTKEYGSAFAKYLWSNYYKYNTGIFYNKRNDYRELIAYAQGNQSIDRHKQSFELDKQQDNSWVNIDWRVRNYCTKRVNVLTNMMSGEEYYARFDAIDATARNQKRMYEANLRSLMDLQEWYQNIAPYMASSPVMAQKIPETEEDLQMHMKDDYKHNFAMEMELVNDLIMNINSWRKIQKKISFDLVVLGVAAVWAEVGKNGFPEVKYIDPAKVVVGASRDEEYSDQTKAGYVEEINISTLRKMAGNQLSKSDYDFILDNVATQFPDRTLGDYYDYYETYTNRGDDNQVAIMNFYFISDIEDTYEIRMRSDGTTAMHPVSSKKGKGKSYVTKVNAEGVKYRTNGKNQIYTDRYQVVYSGTWIIGTDFVFNYGMKSNMERDQKNINKVYPPLHLMAPNLQRNQVTSTVTQMMPVLDDIQNYTNRLNRDIAASVPKGVYIDLDALENANMQGDSGKTMGPKELLRLYMEKGIVVGRNTDVTGGASNPYPIKELQNGISADVLTYVRLIENKRLELDEIIGFNELMAGSTPNPKMGKAVAMMSMAQSNHAISHLFKGVQSLFERVTRSNTRNYQQAVKRGTAFQMAEALGFNSIDFMSFNTDISEHDYGFELDILPNGEEWAEFYQLISSALGKPDGIDIVDFIYIKNVKNLKQAQKVFEVRLDRKKKQHAEEQALQVQQNAMVQQQSAAAAKQAEVEAAMVIEQEKRKTLEVESDLKIREIRVEKDLELRNQQQMTEMKGLVAQDVEEVKGQQKKELANVEKTTLQKKIEQ